MEIVVEVNGLEQQMAFHTAFFQAVQTEVVGVLAEVGEKTVQLSKAKAPVFTGTLSARIAARVNRRSLSVRIKSRAPHATIVARGRLAGKMPPPSMLKAWADARGLHGKEFILARAIAKRGTRPHPYLEPVDESEFQAAVDAAVDRATTRART